MRFNLNLSLLSFLIIFFSFSAVSCKEEATQPDDDNDPEAELSLNINSFQFEAAGGTQTLQVSSNTSWSINYNNSLWARPSIQTSRGNATITINADGNETTDTRTMTMTVTAEGADDLEISITQAGADPVAQEPFKPDFIEPDQTDMRNLTSIELSELMGLGWNVGNSLEAILVNNGNYSGNETSWGNPPISQRLIDSVKAAGFNTVRIPASWSHMIVAEDSFYISYEWKQRVEEVVNYVIENDMYAILNVHWDGGWMNQPYYDNQDEINEKLAAFWKQIAKYFRDYNDYLLFAGTNEVHVSGDFGTPSAENADVQNSFNQTFINTVRATGGRNTFRHLVVQGYNTNIEHTINFLEIPEDPTADRMMVEVHFYDPYQFALQEDGNVYLWGEENAGSSAHAGWGDESWVDETFASVKTNFVDKGYPVIMGEYGAIFREISNATAQQEHINSRNYYLNYVTQAALANGMVPVYWDNGDIDDLGFGLFNRSTGEFAHKDAIEAIVSANN